MMDNIILRRLNYTCLIIVYFDLENITDWIEDIVFFIRKNFKVSRKVIIYTIEIYTYIFAYIYVYIYYDNNRALLCPIVNHV